MKPPLLWRLAACAALALGASACGPSPTKVAPPDTAAPDAAAPDAGLGADAADAPRCTPGGTNALEPAVVACAQGNPTRLVVDDVNVYWTVQRRGAVVMKAPLAGGDASPMVYDDAAAVGLAVDARYVYFTQPARGRVSRVPIAGGPASTVAAGLDAPTFLAIGEAPDGPSLYWTGGQSPGQGTITKLTLADGALPARLVDGQAKPRALAVAGGFVYWTDFADGTILRAPNFLDEAVSTAPRVATRLASGLAGPSDLALARGFAYAPDQGGRVVRVPLEGGALETIATVVGVPFGVASDGVAVYWTTAGDGGLFKAPARPAAPVTTLAAPEADARFLALSPTVVYWGAWGRGGSVRRFAK